MPFPAYRQSYPNFRISQRNPVYPALFACLDISMQLLCQLGVGIFGADLLLFFEAKGAVQGAYTQFQVLFIDDHGDLNL